MTDENIKLLRKDIEHLLSEEYGCNYRIINYDPRPNATTCIFGISLMVEVTINGKTIRACTRKSTNNAVMEEIKKQISCTCPILEKHYL
jgi:hypothetical protein